RTRSRSGTRRRRRTRPSPLYRARNQHPSANSGATSDRSTQPRHENQRCRTKPGGGTSTDPRRRRAMLNLSPSGDDAACGLTCRRWTPQALSKIRTSLEPISAVERAIGAAKEGHTESARLKKARPNRRGGQGRGAPIVVVGSHGEVASPLAKLPASPEIS